jgi:hypothetical protein
LYSAASIGTTVRGLTFFFDRVLLGRLPESVPAHRMQNVVTAHVHKPRDHIAGHIVFAVSDMQA